MLTIEMAKGIIRAGDENAGSVLSLRTDYVGRNMMGKACVGIITPDPSHFLRAAVAYAFELGGRETPDYDEYEKLQDFLRSYHVDSMGYDLIIY